MAQLNCVVVTPEETALEQTADFVAVPLYDGELGILPGHAPMIGRLGYGELRITVGAAEQRYYVDGGFVQVVDNTVSILTNLAVPVAKLDAASAQRQLEEATKRRASTDEERQIRDRLIAQARAKIHVAQRAK